MVRKAESQKSWGPQGLRRRSELMQATVELAAELGFDQTRVSDIVGRVGVGQGVFYWYFESKDALFREILHDTTQRLRLFQAGIIAGEPDPLRRIAKGIYASLDFIAHNQHAFAFLDRAQAQLRAQRAEALRVHVLDTMRHVVEAGTPGDAEIAAHAIAGVVDRLARAYFPQSDVRTVAQEAIDFCVGGLLGSRTYELDELAITTTPALVEIRDLVGAGRPPADGELRAR